jgi:hypothetical protein
MEMEKINHYDVNEVIDRFEIDKIFDCSTLQNWLRIEDETIKPAYQEILEEARVRLSQKWDEWNEEELKIHFISFVLLAAQLEIPKVINTYFERKLSGKVREIPISVVIDCMVATPMKSGRPKAPYFFLQEAPTRPSPKGKEKTKNTHDAEGQMLAAMILAQELNNDQKPLFGSWVQGVNWRFTCLQDNNYCVSRAFDASDEQDLHQIVLILRKLKKMIL